MINENHFRLSYLLGGMFLLFTFFPYIRILPIPTDLQPNALLLACIGFFLYGNRMPRFFLPLLFLSFISISIFLISYSGFYSIRSLMNYLSLFFISYGTYIYLNKRKELSNSLVKISICVWGIVGILQVLVSPTILNFLTYRVAPSFGNRGVVSLAPEPTHYGIIAFFLLLLSIFHLKNRFYVFFCIIQILLLSKSSMVLLFIFIFLLYLMITRLSLKYLIWGLVGIFVISYLILYVLVDSRMNHMFETFIQNPELLILDESINERVAHVYFAIKGFFANYSFSHGFNGAVWKEYVIKEEMFSLYFKDIHYGRINSGYGAALFELGIFGIIIIWSISKSISLYFQNDRKNMILYILLFNTILFSAIPLATPFIGFFIGYFFYYGKQRSNKIIIYQKNV